jgi:hypothetical protein
MLWKNLVNVSDVIKLLFLPVAFKCMKELTLDKDSMNVNNVRKLSDYSVPKCVEELIGG